MNMLRVALACQLIALVLVAVLLTGCGAHGHVAPEVVVRTVTVPVPAKCDAPRPALDAYPDTEAALRAARDIFARVQLLLEARKLRPANEAKLWAYGDGCAGRAP